MKRAYILLSFLLVAFATSSHAEETKPTPTSTDFVRFHEDEKGSQLQTGVATYRNAQGVVVELVGAIHVGDKAYYDKLNERFTHYDALLYEMVGGPYEKRMQRLKVKQSEAGSPAKTEPQAEEMTASDKATHEADLEEDEAAKKLSWLQTLHGTLKSSLGLESQMTCVDYTKPNFVHADMSIKQFTSLQEKRHEGFLDLWWRAVKTEWAHPELMPAQQPGILQILEILSHKDSPTELKRLVGRSFDSVGSIMTGIEGANGTVIVAERNKVALEVLQKQIASGKKNLGIFYGAAHLQDMEKRLLKMGFKLEKTEWLTAWDLPPETRP